MTAWTEDRIRRLTTLWREGRTAAFISLDLGAGISRSAVLGKIYRMGLSEGRPAPVGLSSTTPRARRSGRPAIPAAGPSKPPPTPEAEPRRGTRTILSIRRNDCRWPFGDPAAPGFSLCGCPATRGSFCSPHAARAYRPAPPGLEGLERLAGLT